MTGGLLGLNHKYQQEAPSNRWLHASFWLFLFWGFLVFLISLVFAFPIMQQLKLPDSRDMLLQYLWFIAALPFQSVGFLGDYILLLKKKTRTIWFWGLISGGMHILCLTLPIALTGELVHSIAAYFFWSLIRFGFTWHQVSRLGKISLRFHLIRALWKASWPFYISALAGSYITYLSFLFIRLQTSAETFAIYTYGARELPFTLLLANAFSEAMTTEVRTSGVENSAALIRKSSLRWMHVLFPVSWLFMWISIPVFPFVYSPQFVYSGYIFLVFLLLIIPRMMFPQIFPNGLGKGKVIMLVSFTELAFHLGLTAVAYYFWGIWGAAVTQVISYTVEKSIWMVWNYTQLGLAPSRYMHIPYFLLYTALTLIQYAAIVLLLGNGHFIL